MTFIFYRATPSGWLHGDRLCPKSSQTMVPKTLTFSQALASPKVCSCAIRKIEAVVGRPR